ncbi:MAG: DUF4446 family protein [Patescibacteria group bacterium]
MIFGTDYVIWIALTALVAALIGLGWAIILEFRLKKLFRGRKAEDLQDALAEVQNSLKYFTEKEKEIDEFLEHLEKRVNRSAQHLGIVRFNPYAETGGDQSFSIAVLDEQKNGFVVSGLYNREQSRIYAKPVEAGESQYHLSGEEKTAIEKAVSRYA